jgi:hypothetical protein
LWFEEGSPFLAQLSAELGGIPHKIKPLLWTGENSIYVRDKVAHILADDLSAEHTEHPQATQLVIAHSHGGNIALRAFHHLQMRDGSQHGDDGTSPFVVTLATPFIEIHKADFGPRPLYIRIALVLVMWILSIVLAPGSLLLSLFLLPRLPDAYYAYYSVMLVLVMVVVSVANVFLGWWWIVRKATTRRNVVN